VSSSSSSDIGLWRDRSMPSSSITAAANGSGSPGRKALDLARSYAVDVEYWPTQDPTLTSGNREQILQAYRAVRDGLFAKIKARFPLTGAPSV
jgi:hypothetical protein